MDTSAILKAAGTPSLVVVSARNVGTEPMGGHITKVDSHGIAKLVGLFKGRYEIRADTVKGSAKGSSGGAEVDLGRDPIADLILQPDQEIDITGKFIGSDEDFVSKATSQTTNVRLQQISGFSTYTTLEAPVRNGAFHFAGLAPGTYRIFVGDLQPGYLVKAVHVGSLPTDPDGLANLHNGDTITVTLTDQAATLISRTVARDGKPYGGGVTIMVNPDSTASGQPFITQYRENSLDGNAVFQPLTPGTWIALAFDSFDRLFLRDPETLRKYLPYGTKVELSPKESKMQVLPLVHYDY